MIWFIVKIFYSRFRNIISLSLNNLRVIIMSLSFSSLSYCSIADFFFIKKTCKIYRSQLIEIFFQIIEKLSIWMKEMGNFQIFFLYKNNHNGFMSANKIEWPKKKIKSYWKHLDWDGRYLFNIFFRQFFLALGKVKRKKT